MMNPSENDFAQNDPTASLPTESNPTADNDGRLRRVAQRASTAASETWQATKERTGVARERTEVFVRENPVPVIVGALVAGIALGWALRHATMDDEEEVVSSKLAGLGLGSLSLPALWPFLKSVKEKYDDSAESLKEGVDRLRDIDVAKYTKPIRKRWKAWMD